MSSYFIKVISDNLHNLEELFFGTVSKVYIDYYECLVTGCPRLKVLHPGSEASAESVRCLLLGLPNLIEFKHPAMVLALEQIIKDGETKRVFALRNLYIDGKVIRDFDRVVKSAQVVMNHLGNITEIYIYGLYTRMERLWGLNESLSKVTCLTQLTIKYCKQYTDDIVPIIKAVSHQLKLIDLCGLRDADFSNIFDAINQCRELHTLRVKPIFGRHDPGSGYDNSGNDQAEIVTPFSYLQELSLEGFDHSYLKPALCKSLIASPLLQELTLIDVSSLTDHVLRAAFNHSNDEGEQLAFTSLRKIKLVKCHSITNYLESVVTAVKIPLESLELSQCRNLTYDIICLWNLERYQMDLK